MDKSRWAGEITCNFADISDLTAKKRMVARSIQLSLILFLHIQFHLFSGLVTEASVSKF